MTSYNGQLASVVTLADEPAYVLNVLQGKERLRGDIMLEVHERQTGLYKHLFTYLTMSCKL